jgi:hypothetical protein
MPKRDTTIKTDLSSEDMVRHVLSVGPMPKDEKPPKAAKRAKKPTRRRKAR